MDAFDVRDVEESYRADTAEAHVDPSTRWAGEWVGALNRLELDVTSAEELLRSLHDQVDEPPTELPILGGDWSRERPSSPLPMEFADRARSLLARQTRVSEELAKAMIESRQQLKGLKKFDKAESYARFVDTAL